ncbi:MAG: GTP-binding protein, partial [Gemmatimonadota bacterium]
MTQAPPGERGLRGLVVGTAGHVDHGKTSLVRALTGVETDRWREERERGLTIDIGFAPFALASDLETGVVDVPGHEDFLKNMLAGATGIDLLLLVVAADEGPMPQTWEHLSIARLLDVRRGVVALTKRDRVDTEWLGLAEEATRELLEESGVGDWPIVPVSSVTGEGLDDLREWLRDAAQAVESRRQDDVVRMPVDRAF